MSSHPLGLLCEHILELDTHVVPMLELFHCKAKISVRLVGFLDLSFSAQGSCSLLHAHEEALREHLALPRLLAFHRLVDRLEAIGVKKEFELGDPAVGDVNSGGDDDGVLG